MKVNKQLILSKKFILCATVILIIVALIIGISVHRHNAKTRPEISVPRVANVRITEDGFSPQALNIKAGTEVIWTNSDTDVHYIISNDQGGLASLNSRSNLTTNGTYRYTFDRKGSFTYHDKNNPLNNGLIIVN